MYSYIDWPISLTSLAVIVNGSIKKANK